MKRKDLDSLMWVLVADGEVSRAALKVLTTMRKRDSFERLFRIEIAALLAKIDPENLRDRSLGDLIMAASDRLLRLAPASTSDR